MSSTRSFGNRSRIRWARKEQTRLSKWRRTVDKRLKALEREVALPYPPGDIK